MAAPWHRGAIVIGVLAITALAVAGPIAPATFESRSDIALATQKSIIVHTDEIQQLLTTATQEGKAVKASCIQEKLRRAQKNKDAADTVMNGWGLGKDDPDYAQRQLDRILLLQVYSMVYAQEARACTEVKATADSNQLVITNGSTTPQEPIQDPTRPPFFERPPLASAF
jgi:hypothetical protein